MRMSARALALIGAAGLLAGCASKVGPAPASTLQVPAAWRDQAALAAEHATLAAGGVGPAGVAGATVSVERQWWQAFGDPVLSALVTRALERNGDLRVARERVEEFRARVAIAHAGLLPTLSVNAAPVRTRTLNGFEQPYVTNLISGQLQASYEIDVWNRLGELRDAAAASYRAEQASLDAAALSIAANTASAYLNLRGLDAQLELAEETLRLRQQSLDLARQQFQVGYSSRLEWLQAQSEYQTTAETVPQLKHSIAEQENALAILAGASPGTPDGSIPRGRALFDLAAPVVPAGLPSQLLRRRPDIARAEQGVVAANASLAAQRDQMLPSFKLTAVGGGEALNFSQFIHAPVALWQIGGSVLAPLFEGGRLQAETDVAAAQRNASLYNYDNVVRNAFAETDNGITAVFRLREQAVQNDARRATAAETLRIAHNRYANGYASYLEELDAQRTLYSADVGRLQLKARILVASVDLYRALGGGWRPQAAAE